MCACRSSSTKPEDAKPAVAAGDIDLAGTHHYRHLPRPDLTGLTQHLPHGDRSCSLCHRAFTRPDDTAARLTDLSGGDPAVETPREGFQAVTELGCRAAGFEPHVRFAQTPTT